MDDKEVLILITNYMLDTNKTRLGLFSEINESYHNSWKYLMKAVEKIQQDILIDVVISRNKCIIADIHVLNNLISKHKSYYDEVNDETTFKAVRKAVCNFIKHENKIKYG